MEKSLNTLVYKRTHTGDPNTSGVFGCHDCMGRVRGYAFDAAIGIGGIRPDRGYEDLALKINWIGISPRPDSRPGLRGPLITFEHFVLWEEVGPDLKEHASKLFRHMFEDKHVRWLMSKNVSPQIEKEVRDLLALADTFQPSKPSRVFEKSKSPKRKC